VKVWIALLPHPFPSFPQIFHQFRFIENFSLLLTTTTALFILHEYISYAARNKERMGKGKISQTLALASKVLLIRASRALSHRQCLGNANGVRCKVNGVQKNKQKETKLVLQPTAFTTMETIFLLGPFLLPNLLYTN